MNTEGYESTKTSSKPPSLLDVNYFCIVALDTVDDDYHNCPNLLLKFIATYLERQSFKYVSLRERP